MSRIHEALKKAKLASSAAHEVAGAPPTQGFQTAEGIKLADPAMADPIPTGRPLISPPSKTDALLSEELRDRCSHPTWKPKPDTNVFDPAQSVHGAEQFRTLRSRLYQFRATHPVRIVLVTSSVAAEGKTFVVSNLARAIVRQPDRKALIIDADLRCSRVHIPLGAPPSPGLTDYLRGKASESEVIQVGPEGNLYLIPGGTLAPNPSELLANGRLRALFDRVAPMFDWILIDSPPCLPVADASVIADISDAVLLVVKAASTPAGVVQRAQRELQDKNIAGVVMNSVDEEALGYASYYSAYGGYGNDSTNHDLEGPSTLRTSALGKESTA